MLLSLALLTLLGCGYGFTAKEDTVLSQRKSPAATELAATPFATGPKTMRVKAIEHPVVYPWLSQVIRSSLRDEFARRNIAKWKDDGAAEYSIMVKVTSFTIRSSVRDANSNDLLVSASLVIDATVFDERTNAQVWRSGSIGHSETYESRDEQTAASELTERVMQQLAGRMRRQF